MKICIHTVGCPKSTNFILSAFPAANNVMSKSRNISTNGPLPSLAYFGRAALQQSPGRHSALGGLSRNRALPLARNVNCAASRTISTTNNSISSSSGTYAAYGITKKMFQACAAQADYKISEELKKAGKIPKTAAGEDIGVGSGWWYEDFGLLPTFSTWSQITFLHMYLVTVRLRTFSPENFQLYFRYFFDHFSHEAERRMDVLHGISSRSIRVQYLKDLFLQWRGVLAAYDEGIVKGDAVLASAVWRNLWKASLTDRDGEAIDWIKVAYIVAYMRQNLNRLGKIDQSTLVGGVGDYFNRPENVERWIKQKSVGWAAPLNGDRVNATRQGEASS